MNEQEIFTRVYEVLRDRGFTRAGVMREDDAGEHFQCQYRSPIGPCAIGIFLTNEEYDPQMDVTCLEASSIRRASAILEASSVTNDFLDSLQASHDGGNTPERMRNSLESFALRYNLVVPA